MTKQRELILSILKQSDRHLTADEIFFLAKLKMPSIAMATIYNNLNAMNELGIIKRLHIDGVADCFDKVMEPHDHLLCDRCGKITDIHLPALADTLENELSTEIEDYELTVHYICPECRSNSRRRSATAE
jgi:Fe2+ or Zn2+ uptake regulation protein